MEQWEQNYYISSIAGATNGSSLVVMSKGLLEHVSSALISLNFSIFIHNQQIISKTSFFAFCANQELLTRSSRIKLANPFLSSG